jgi:hypothetical protein
VVTVVARSAGVELVSWVSGGVDEEKHQGAMYMNWKGLGEEISNVVCSFDPSDFELALANTVMHPVVAHFDGFAAAHLEGIVGYADGTEVVTEDG